jgi:hypothetical protein
MMEEPMAIKKDVGLLELELVDTIPADGLKEVIGIIDELYFGHLWLDLAEQADAGDPMPDQYAPTVEETLYVSRMEIGTPNFLEVLGLASPLMEVFTYIGGIGGLIASAKGLISIVEGVQRHREKRLDYRIKEVDLEIRQYDLRLKRLQLEEAIRKAEAQGNIRKHAVDLRARSGDLAERAQLLHARISPEALEHKMAMSMDLQWKASYFLPRYAREPSLTVVRSRE